MKWRWDRKIQCGGEREWAEPGDVRVSDAAMDFAVLSLM